MAENSSAQGPFTISILQLHPSPTYAQSHGKYAPYRQLPVSLPPLRGLEEASQSHTMALPIHNSVYSNAPILPHVPATHSGIPGPLVGGTPMGVIRHPLPMVAPLMLSDARHKSREIKRRSKTGCMTCRKRRIKCDESHPICKNCIKSKRTCLGLTKAQTGQPSLELATPTTGPNVSSAQASSATSLMARSYSRSPPNVPDSSTAQQLLLCVDHARSKAD
jgi:white-opaque regulator 2